MRRKHSAPRTGIFGLDIAFFLHAKEKQMEIRKLTLVMGLTMTAMTLAGVPGLAQAVPMLQIVGSGGGAPDPANAEAIGDPGGTLYTNAPTPNASAGPGMPTALGGWPIGPGLAPDSGFNNSLGISGWDASYLKLAGLGTGSTNITFQFMGKGNARITTCSNSF